MYIRTKDGRIIDTTKYPEHPASWSVQASDYALTIAQSENLKELCDDFVGLIKDRNSDFIITKVIAHSLKELKDSLKTEFNGKTYYGKFDIIYGAIWTDKGLIYVAKMDSEGKLELI